MKALITGASSGIGLEMAKYLSEKGFDLILVARGKERLEELQSIIGKKVKIVVMDLSNESNLKSLYVLCKNEEIDVLINNAGFGNFGLFSETELSRDLEMINLNIKAVHVLTKLFIRDMQRKNRGYILNVSSAAGFQPGPLMATYYSTKAYVLRLTQAISYELKKEKSNVSISCLCPGPVDTNFNNVAGVKFSIKPMDSRIVARYAIDQMFKKKRVIVPGFKMKVTKFGDRFLSDNFIMKIAYNIQKKKQK